MGAETATGTAPVFFPVAQSELADRCGRTGLAATRAIGEGQAEERGGRTLERAHFGILAGILEFFIYFRQDNLSEVGF